MADSHQAHSLFVRLTQDIFAEIRQETPELSSDPSAPMAIDLTVDDVEFTVAYNPFVSLERISVFCRFGKIPEHKEVAILYRLLETNLAISLDQSISFGVEPETHEVIFHFNGVLEDVTAKQLLGSLILAAGQARKWKDNYFLDDFEIAPRPTEMSQQWIAS